jgi:hypothetical protein
MNFTQQFKAARAVSTPLICVRTSDPASTIRNLSVAAAELATETKASEPAVLTWDVGRGLRGFNEAGKRELGRLLGQTPADATKAPPNFLRLIENAAEDTLIFMANAHRFWPDVNIMQLLWNLRDVFKQKGQTLVPMSTMGAVLPAELQQDVLVLDEPLPSPEQLAEIIKDTFKAAKAKEPKPATVTKAVEATVGLSAFTAEQQSAMSLGVDGLNLSDLWERKRQVIEQVRGLSVWRGGERFKDLGGLDNAKTYFSRLCNGPEGYDGIVFTDEIEKVFAGFGTDSSGTTTKSVGAVLTYMEDKKVAGSLFLGPPGSGKSALAKAIGNEAGIPTVSADWAAMETSLVGATGENVRAALAIITAMFRKPLFIATCNSWGALPPELRRRYWLPTFFFDILTATERTLVWPIHMKDNGIKEQELPDDKDWTGAEIRNCCRNARQLECSLKEAASYVVPVAISAAEQIQKLRSEATGKFISAAAPGFYRFEAGPAAASPTNQIRRLRVRTADIHNDEGGFDA